MAMSRCVAILAAVGALSFSPVAGAQETAGQPIPITDIQAAQLLMASGKFDEAKLLLTTASQERPDDSETLFLLGTIAVAQKDYDSAISLYRRILVNEPNVERVRLELARAFFLKGDYDNADRQFRFARAGDVPDAVKANIDRFLAAIDRLRQWTFNFSLALAPNTNENAGTSLSQVTIYGLPFALDSTARRKSGIGLAGDLGGEWSPLIANNLKARVGADAYRIEYGGSSYDDMTLSAYAGPQLLFSGGNVSALVTGFQRWYGNRPYVDGFGGKLAAEVGITSNLLIGASAGGTDVFYSNNSAQSGPLFSAAVQASYVLSPSTVFSLQSGFNRQDASYPAFSYTGIWFGGGYSQDLPFGFSAGFQPSFFMTRYDAPLAAFGVIRSDNTLMLNLNLLNRRFDYHGFTPRLSYTFTDQHSNVALYGYTQSQFQIGITSQF